VVPYLVRGSQHAEQATTRPLAASPRCPSIFLSLASRNDKVLQVCAVDDKSQKSSRTDAKQIPQRAGYLPASHRFGKPSEHRGH
jgi:hypothetical protein